MIEIEEREVGTAGVIPRSPLGHEMSQSTALKIEAAAS